MELCQVMRKNCRSGAYYSLYTIVRLLKNIEQGQYVRENVHEVKILLEDSWLLVQALWVGPNCHIEKFIPQFFSLFFSVLSQSREIN